MISVREAEERSRFEVLVDDTVVGFAVYHSEDGQMAFPHTEVDPEHQGHGLGGQLVRGGLDAARERGSEVLPYCPFVSAWIGKHPEYMHLVPEPRRESFGLSDGREREAAR